MGLETHDSLVGSARQHISFYHYYIVIAGPKKKTYIRLTSELTTDLCQRDSEARVDPREAGTAALVLISRRSRSFLSNDLLQSSSWPSSVPVMSLHWNEYLQLSWVYDVALVKPSCAQYRSTHSETSKEIVSSLKSPWSTSSRRYHPDY